MKIDVHMLDTQTRERAVFRPDWTEQDGDFSIWSDGNFSCDCNRSDFFAEAIGREADEDPPCGDGRFIVEKIVERGTDRVLYAETEPST